MKVSTTTQCGDNEITGQIDVKRYLDDGSIFLIAYDLSGGGEPLHATVILTSAQAREVANGLLVAALSSDEVRL